MTLFDRRAGLAWILVCVVLVASAIGFQAAVGVLNVYLRKEPVELRDHFDSIPMILDDWTGERQPKLSTEMVEELGTSLYLDAEFRRGAGAEREAIGLHIAYYTGFIDAVPHVPDRCLVAAGYDMVERPRSIPLELRRIGWREDDSVRAADGRPFETVLVADPVTGRRERVRMPLGDLSLRVSVYTSDKHPDLRLAAGYFFVANGGVATTPGEVKALAFDPSQRHAYYCKVQFSAVYPRDFRIEDFGDRAARLLEPLLPQLMRCLPDWAEIEQLDAPATAASSPAGPA